MLYIIDRSIGAIKRAEEQGLRTVLPKGNQLLIDLDSEEQYQTYLKRFARVQESLFIQEVYNQPSKSGLPKRHIIIELEKSIDVRERLILQLYLGSDPIREFLSYLRFLQDDPFPSLFFEKKEDTK